MSLTLAVSENFSCSPDSFSTAAKESPMLPWLLASCCRIPLSHWVTWYQCIHIILCNIQQHFCHAIQDIPCALALNVYVHTPLLMGWIVICVPSQINVYASHTIAMYYIIMYIASLAAGTQLMPRDLHMQLHCNRVQLHCNRVDSHWCKSATDHTTLWIDLANE